MEAVEPEVRGERAEIARAGAGLNAGRIDDRLSEAAPVVGASSTSAGKATNTGPVGGVDAILMARRSTRSNDPGSTTRVAHLVTGRAMPTRSAAICASMAS
jgi:hypothetical protein